MPDHSPIDTTTAIVGNQPEALLLSVLFAEANTPTFLTGLFEPATQKPTGRSGREEAAWLLGIHTKAQRIRLLEDPNTLPLQDIRRLVITDHSTLQGETTELERTVRGLAKNVVKGTDIILTGLCRPGTTRKIGGIIQQFSGLEVGKEFSLSYLPLLWNGEPLLAFREKPRILATLGGRARHVQQMFLNVFPSISSSDHLNSAEAAGLFAPLYYDVVRALELELASICEQEHVDYSDALELSRGAGLQFLGTPRTIPSRYSIASLIAASAAQRPKGARLIRTARRVNEEANQRVLSLIKNALSQCGRRLRRSKIAIVGLDGLRGRLEAKPETPQLLQMLRRRGAILSLYPGDGRDWSHTLSSDYFRVESSVSKTVERTHCAVIAIDRLENGELSPQKLASEMSRPAAVCDLTGVMEASNVERAGLIYTSIGRGSPEA